MLAIVALKLVVLLCSVFQPDDNKVAKEDRRRVPSPAKDQFISNLYRFFYKLNPTVTISSSMGNMAETSQSPAVDLDEVGHDQAIWSWLLPVLDETAVV
jgi:hypothetical protein